MCMYMISLVYQARPLFSLSRKGVRWVWQEKSLAQVTAEVKLITDEAILTY